MKNSSIFTCPPSDSDNVIYRKRLNAPSPYYASLIARTSRLDLASANATITVVAAGKLFNERVHNDLWDSLKATPTIAGRHLHARTGSHLHALSDN